MINPLHERQWTQRGTVVYKRRPRSPKPSDVLRFATAAAVQRILVGKKLFEELRQIAISGVKAVEEYQELFGIRALTTTETSEPRIYIIEEEL